MMLRLPELDMIGRISEPVRESLPPSGLYTTWLLGSRVMSDHSRKPCAFDGCDGLAKAKGLCHIHYCQQWEGKPLTPIKRCRKRNVPLVIPFDEVPCPRSDLEGPCHIFRGQKVGYGYGRISVGGRGVLVHRYVWERTHGPIPQGLEIDHQCRNYACCNAKHLRLVTHQVNSTENIVGAHWQLLAAKTHCPRGHEYTPENTRKRPGRGGRDCRECARIRKKERRRGAQETLFVRE